jgi:predicted acylesterase/phospholipase RssA
MKALFEGSASTSGGNGPPEVRIFTGTSVGAYNAAFLAQQENTDADSIATLEALWRNRIADTLTSCGNGVYRLRFDPLRFLNPGCLAHPLRLAANVGRDAFFWGTYAALYGGQFLASTAPLEIRVTESFNLTALFSREPFERLLLDTLDASRLGSSPNALAVAVSDWINGTSKVFSKADVLRLGTDAILASAAIPGVFRPVLLEGTVYVDGGVLMNTPLRPAIDLGGDVLHVIFVDPETNEIPLPIQEGVLPNTSDSLYRFYTILLATQLRHDMRHLATINEEIAALAAGAAALGSELPAVRARRRRREASRAQEEKRYRPITVHTYRPKTELGGIQGFLDFDLESVNGLIQQGYEDAVHHDCTEAQCVLPPEVPPATRAGRRRTS